MAYELPDGRLKLIDGHLRRDIDPDLEVEVEVEVEVLDLTDNEARTLLLSLDPLAALADTRNQIHDRLRELTPPPSPELEALWEATAAGCHPQSPTSPADVTPPPIVEQFLVMIRCDDEKQQVELLGRFRGEGLDCRALVG